MNKLFVPLILAICLLAASCTKNNRKEVEEKLVGTWLMKTNGSDVNGNGTYDAIERTPHDSTESKVTLTFKNDGTFLQVNQYFSPGSTKNYPGKWELQKNSTQKLNMVFDDGMAIEAGIEVLTDKEFVMEHMHGLWNGYVRQ
ncbi:lipocalin family protein [Polluticoccus soli]|uniref:lipocalin family protein n=1 Tax=Polluticoccus soli TaxID=3034150 RepID=UPI0023E0AA7F|nr:lipocalin family protein [Flavipsychrobacter sp. JY13-12]